MELVNNTAPTDNVIDMSDPDYSHQLISSLQSNRYAILKSHLVKLDSLNTLYQEWSDFFASPIEFKQKFLYSSITDDGYVPINAEYPKNTTNPDHKEFYQIHLDGLTSHQHTCSLEMKNLFEELSILGESLIKALDETLPKKIKDSMINPLWLSTKGSTRHCMRLIHYPPCGDNSDPYRSAPHDDICLLTIIIPTQGEGLMIEENNCWQEKNSNDCNLLVFNSEMLEICTNGYLKSMTHHVTTDLTENARFTSRYSMPFFVHPKPSMLLEKDLTSHAAVRQRIIDTKLDKIVSVS